MVIDAAHNPASAEAFADVLQEKYADQRPTLLLGMLADKTGTASSPPSPHWRTAWCACR